MQFHLTHKKKIKLQHNVSQRKKKTKNKMTLTSDKNKKFHFSKKLSSIGQISLKI